MSSRHNSAILPVALGIFLTFPFCVTSSLADEFNPAHFCASAPVADENCAFLRKIKNPDFTTKSDFIIIPHRGLWGAQLGSGLPENSVEAYKAAYQAGYRFVEVDVMSTLEGLPNNAGATSPLMRFMNHDYELSRLISTPPRIYSFTMPQPILGVYFRKRRNGTLSTSKVLTLDQIVTDMYPFSETYGLSLDIKSVDCRTTTNPNNCEEFNTLRNFSQRDFINTARSAIQEAIDHEAFASLLMIKASMSYATIAFGGKEADGTAFDGVGEDKMARVLWVPVIHAAAARPADPTDSEKWSNNLADIVDTWASHNNIVAYFETSYANAGDQLLKGFTRSEGPHAGENYTSIPNYIAETTGKRIGFFSWDPAGPRGNATRWATWYFPNTTNDYRANAKEVISQEPVEMYALHMVMTTDNPPMWLKAVAYYSGGQVGLSAANYKGSGK